MLAAAPMPVAVLPGNHDVLDERSLWHRTSAEGIHLLDRPHGSVVTLLDGRLHLWGRAMEERPLPAAGRRPGPPTGRRVRRGRTRAARGGREPPFVARPDGSVTGADYVALGHIHVRRDVSVGEVAAWYSGAPLGMVASGTCNVVTIDGGSARRDRQGPRTGRRVRRWQVKTLAQYGGRSCVPAGHFLVLAAHRAQARPIWTQVAGSGRSSGLGCGTPPGPPIRSPPESAVAVASAAGRSSVPASRP